MAEKNRSLEEHSDHISRKRKYPFSYAASRPFSGSLDTPTTSFPTYTKTWGINNLGFEYQQLTCALYALEFSFNDKINDFQLTTNNNEYQIFDDMVIDVEFKDKTKIKFAFQLKHGEPQRNLSIGDFARQTKKNKSFLKNAYCLTKHIDFIKSVSDDTLVCILFTNNTTSLTDGVEIDLEPNKVTVRKCDSFTYSDLLINSESTKSCDIFHLEISGANSSEKYQTQFYLFTNQDNVYVTRLSVEKRFKKLVRNDTYGSFDYFMKNWWAGNFILTKTDVISKLVELSLSPYIKAISGEHKNQKSKQLAKCILSFDITLVDPSAYNIVTKIWEEAESVRKITSTFSTEVKKIGLTALKYSLTAHVMPREEEFSYQKSANVINSLSSVQISKTLWYQDLVPLIIKVDKDCQQEVANALQLLDGHFNKKKFVLLVEDFDLMGSNWNMFRTLTDLIKSENNDLCMYIVNNFDISIQGKQAVLLKDFLQLDEEASDLLRVKELLQMTQKTLTVGKSEELPDFYLSRNISAIFLDREKLLKCYANCSRSLLIVNCEKRFEIIFKILPTVDLSVFLTTREFDGIDNLILMSTNGGCTVSQFNTVCQISGKSVYVIQIYDQKCVLLMKKGDGLPLDDMVWKEDIRDVTTMKIFTNPLNVVCGPVGTGKSTLFAILNKICLPQFWSVVVNLREYASFLKMKPDDEAMLQLFLQPSDDPFTNRYKRFLLKTKKMYLFLDEVDHLSSEIVDHVLHFIEKVSSQGASVWVSSRDPFSQKMVDFFNTVPLQIGELDRVEQRKYFHNRYSVKETELIFKSVSVAKCDHLLQFPLGLQIISEALSQKLNDGCVVPVSSLFNWVVDGLLKFFWHKLSLDQFEYLAFFHFDHYKMFGLKCCLTDKSCAKLKIKTTWLEEIGRDDKLGLVKTVGPQPEFIHQQYAEYFAALWFSENLSCLSQVPEEYFSERNESMRFILDIILANEDSLFVSVIYNEEVEGERLQKKDKGGRTPLHLASSYGVRYPNNCSFDVRANRDCQTYMDFLEKLLNLENGVAKCEIFNFASLAYAVCSRCLYAVEKLLTLCPADDATNKLCEIYNTQTLAFYSSQLGYPNLLRLAIDRNRNLINEKFGGYSLLELAILGGSDDDYTSNRTGNINVLKSLLEVDNRENILTELLTFAVSHVCYDMIKVLITLGAKSSTLLHQLVIDGTLNEEMLTLFKEVDTDLSILGAQGKSLLDLAFERGDTNLATLLLKEGIVSNSGTNMAPVPYTVLLPNKEEVRTLEDWTKQETQLSADLQKNLTFGDSLSQRGTSQTIETNSMFVKRQGTSSSGRDYEIAVMAHLVLKLITDDRVTDFSLSADDEAYGYFDDIVLNIKSDKRAPIYAFQLKHSERPKNLTINHLSHSKGVFSLLKYFSSFQEIYKRGIFCDFIVFTSWKCGLPNDQVIKLDERALSVKVVEWQTEPFLHTCEGEGICYKFEVIAPDDQTTTSYEDYQNFFSHFFLYTNQANFFQLTKQNKYLFETLFSSGNTYMEVVNFLREWNLRRGRIEKLNKQWMQNFVSLTLLSPLIKPLSFGSINHKMKLLQEATSHFSVTIFDDHVNDGIKFLYGDLSIDDIDERAINHLTLRYQMDRSVVDDSTRTKILWLLGKCPLVVPSEPCVLKAIELCPHQKFILLGECPPGWQLRPSVFQNLTKLDPESKIYKDVLTGFQFSIQGKREVNLEYLLDQDGDFLNYLTPTDLAEMVDDGYTVGDKEILPDPYMVRFLSRNVISCKYLDNVDGNTTFVLISCLNRNTDIDRYNLTNINQLDKRVSRYYSVDQYSFDKFEEICATYIGLERYHHFKFVEDGHLEWLQSRGDITDLSFYRIDGYFIDETEILTARPHNKINVVNGAPGTGKTVLLRRFKNEIQSLVFVLCPEDISKLCSDHCEMKEFLLKTKCNSDKNFEEKVMKMLIEKNQVVYLWDGLDELSPDVKDHVLTLIDRLSENLTQWITCRDSLQNELETRFSVLARHLRPFNEDEQKFYLMKRRQSMDFNGSEETIECLVSTLRLPQNENIVGFPLTLFLITELLHEKTISSFKQEQLSLVDIYNQFIDRRFDMYVCKLNSSTNFLRQFLENYKWTSIKKYEKLALQSLFPADFLNQLNIDTDGIQKEEDPFGFVFQIDANTTKFVHRSFAEFFAASYLCKCYTRITHLELIFEEEYTNVRFFFDLILANKSSAHRAVLHKNLDLLKQVEDLRTCKDMGGRSPLHLAASWGKRYPLLKIERNGNRHEIYDLGINDLTPDDPEYVKALLFLVDKCDSSELDGIFGMGPSSYAATTNCVFPRVKLLHKESQVISEFDDSLINVLYYSAKLGYDEVLDFCQDLPFLVTEQKHHTLLHVAANHKPFFSKLLNFDIYRNAIFHRDEDGRTPLHCAIHLGEDIVQRLIALGADLNACDAEGATPLYLACENGQIECVKLLLESGADLQVRNRDGYTPLHVACETSQKDIVQLLILCGADINYGAMGGDTPLHIAYGKGYNEIVEVLLKAGADINIVNGENFTPMQVPLRKSDGAVMDFADG